MNERRPLPAEGGFNAPEPSSAARRATAEVCEAVQDTLASLLLSNAPTLYPRRREGLQAQGAIFGPGAAAT